MLYAGGMTLQKTPIPTVWVAPVDEWQSALKAAQLSPNTIKTRVDRFRQFARWYEAGPAECTTKTLMEYSAAHEWSCETRRSVHATLQSFFRWFHGAGYADIDISAGLPKVKPSSPKPRPAPDSAVRSGLENGGNREYFILSLAAYVGLRREEIVKVHSKDIIEDILGYSLRVHGKGNKERIVPLPELLARQVIAECARNAGYLLPGNIDGHMSARYAGKLATRCLPGDITLHMLRHRFGTVAYNRSKDIAAVQDILGHTNPATTRRYIAVENSRLREVVSLAG